MASSEQNMTKSQINATLLALSVLAAAFGFFLLSGAFFWIGSIAGLTLAIVLLAFDGESFRTLVESLAFAAALGLSLTLAIASPLAWVRAHNAQSASFAGPIGADWLPYIWIALTILFWIVDRARMSARVQHAPAERAVFSVRSNPVPMAPASPPSPERAAWGTESRSTPVEAEPVTHPEPVVEPAPAPPPRAIPVPAGKEAMIYVSLVGEGLNVLRAVRAEHLGRDFYKIAEDMPEGETWQFGPGQIVRCRKKNLSSGKAMVAIEEAPRAQ
jgi:hypothetical protein